MFDDSESDEEIKDSANESHNELNVLTEVNEPELFSCILNMMDYNKIYKIHHKSDKYLTQKELNHITKLFNKFSNKEIVSYFTDFNPKDGDYSIIFKYLRNVHKLGDFCFRSCLHLIKINLPDSITLIPSFCFFNCINLKEIIIPDSVTEIGNGCFENCKNLTKITLPNSIIHIGNCSFSGCHSLRSITIPKKFKNSIQDLFWLVDLSKVKITYI